MKLRFLAAALLLALPSPQSQQEDVYVNVSTSGVQIEKYLSRWDGHLLYHSAEIGIAVGVFRNAPPGWIRSGNAYALSESSLDPLLPLQWNLNAVQAVEAWDWETANPASIAIIDSGIAAGVADLDYDQIAFGYDYVDRDEDPTDLNGHGTAVASILGAVRQNGEGLAGLSNSPLHIIRVLDENGRGRCVFVALALLDAIEAGARVVNLSLACDIEDPSLDVALRYANSRGVAIVAAASSLRGVTGTCTFPASHPNVIAVAALAEDDTSLSHACTGGSVKLAGPGSKIPAAGLTGYPLVSGASFAAPHVAAAFAVIMSRNPSLTPEDASSILAKTARDVQP